MQKKKKQKTKNLLPSVCAWVKAPRMLVTESLYKTVFETRSEDV